MTQPRARHLAWLAASVAVATLGVVACSASPTLPPIATPSPTPIVTPDARTCPTTAPDPLPAGETRTVTITTSLGAITIKVEADLAPRAAGNFVALAECGFYEGVVFHRAATLQDGTPFVIQGGDPQGTGFGGPGYTIQDDPVTATYQRGTVAMARTPEPNSQGSQFFIVLSDAAGPILASSNTYAIFGAVTSGLGIVDAIYARADAEIPPNPVVMDSVTISNP